MKEETPIYTSCRDTLLDYEYLERLLCLDRRDADINRRLLNDSFNDITYFLGFSVEEAGYTAQTLPDELKEAAVSIFLHKSTMYKKATDYEYGDNMDDILEQKFDDGILDFDEFFDEFSTIPLDAQVILLRFAENLKAVSA